MIVAPYSIKVVNNELSDVGRGGVSAITLGVVKTIIGIVKTAGCWVVDG